MDTRLADTVTASAQNPGYVTALAAQAVISTLLGRAPTRLNRVSLRSGVEYALAPYPVALQLNRGLLEDVVVAQLAGDAARHILGVHIQGQQGTALLEQSLMHPEEREVLAAYEQVLFARARALVRQHWAEIQVVAAGLTECGDLSGEAVKWRMNCAQGIRGQLLN